MREINLIIYDKDYFYLKNFMKFINSNYNDYFNCIGITSKEELKKLILSGKTIDILLINEELVSCTPEISMIKLVITLNESENNNNVDSKIVFKYQNGHAIFNFIQKIYSVVNNGQSFRNKDLDTKVISFFSPIGGVGNTTISLLSAINLAKCGKKVLYLNLEYIPTISLYFKENNNPNTLIDLFYKMSEKVEVNKEILNTFINRNEFINVYYINPIISTVEYEEIDINGFISIIDKIKKELDFDFIIVDLNISIKDSIIFLSEYCDKSIGILTSSRSDIYKMDRYLSEIVKDDKIILLINKHKIEVINSLRTNNLIIDNKIYDYITYDEKLENRNTDIDTLINAKEINLKINEFISRLLRGELIG